MSVGTTICNFYTNSFVGLLFSLNQFDVTLPNIPILLDNVICIGNETSVLQCSHGGFNNYFCGHPGDIVIECFGKISTQLR